MNEMKIYIILLVLLFANGACWQADGKNRKTDKDHSIIIQNIFPFQQQHCHGSTIVELPNKDLLVAWFQGSGERTADDVQIKGARYNHRTGKWGEPFTMADTDGFPDINPVLFVDNNNRLWLVWYTVMAYQWSTSLIKYQVSDDFQQKEGAPEWKWQDVLHVKADGEPNHGIGRNDAFVQTLNRKFDEYYRYLEDSGQMESLAELGVTKEKLNQYRDWYLSITRGENLMSDGTDINEKGEQVKKKLGYPLMRRIGWQTRNKPLFADGKMILPLYSDGLNLSLMAITENSGKTWQFSEPILGGGAIQPTLAENKDGSITILMRDNGPAPHRLQKSISKDGGFTWSMVHDTDIPNPGTAADVVVLKSGNWALVHNDIEEGRYRMSIWLSEDEGKTWPYRKIIVNGEPGSQVRGHYPAIIQGSDGMIHISYTNQIAAPDGKSSVKNIAHAVFSEKWLKEKAQPGKETVLRLEPGEGNPRNSEGDFIQLRDGRILFIYTKFTGGSGDNAHASLVSCSSSDKGKTWSQEDIKVVANEGNMNVMSVSLLRLNDERIALFYLRKNSRTDCIPYMRVSDDEAQTWGPPVKCINEPGYYVMNNSRVVRLKRGRIILPVAQHNTPENKRFDNGKISCYYSDDEGKTWNHSSLVPDPNNIKLQEPGIVELKNNTVMLFCRTDAGVQYISFSKDGCKTWTPIVPGNIKSPLSPASIKRIPKTGDLLLVWNNNFEKGKDGGKRTPFNIAISKDEGKTWIKTKTLEDNPDGWYCYTAINFIDDYVLLGHCAGNRKHSNGLETTQITRLSLNWIYDNGVANPQ